MKAIKELESLNVFSLSESSKRTLRRITISDVSKMEHGNVCLFGFDSENNPIRPEIPYKGISKKYIIDGNDNQIIHPFSIVEFDFIRSDPQIPHTEDHIINPCFKPVFIRQIDDHEAEHFLESILDHDVRSIFGTEIHENRFTKKYQGNRSIGTVLVKYVQEISYRRTYSKKNKTNKHHFKIRFVDFSGDEYERPITDCAFQNYYLNTLKLGINPRTLNDKLKSYFNDHKFFIRIGLGRYYNNGHWLIATGLYTFPDYKENLQFTGE
ncbi:MAG: dual OB domain-containing protein [Methanobacterium sp.]